MSPQSLNLPSLARSKLNLPGDSRDSFSLHRWVLLKNSLVQSNALPPSTPSTDEDDADDETDSFMFPDAGQLVVEGPSTEADAAEAAWVDALLETLEDDDDDFSADSDVHVSVEPVDDDDDLSHSPPISPMSSSDDLTLHYYPHLVPYPPYPQQFISYHLTPPLASSNSPYVDPLPYLDDLDIPPVPDAIEDTSDDESSSEAPLTPGHSLSSLSLDPASIPLPTENSRLRYANPHVYIDSEDDEYFYPFDPLPFPDDHRSPIQYTECC